MCILNLFIIYCIITAQPRVVSSVQVMYKKPSASFLCSQTSFIRVSPLSRYLPLTKKQREPVSGSLILFLMMQLKWQADRSLGTRYLVLSISGNFEVALFSQMTGILSWYLSLILSASCFLFSVLIILVRWLNNLSLTVIWMSLFVTLH